MNIIDNITTIVNANILIPIPITQVADMQLYHAVLLASVWAFFSLLSYVMGIGISSFFCRTVELLELFTP
ncbi:hypothetical protein GO685_02305 [Wolbachia endosymbiont of Madathamugadia hiepei]|uniref:hypothetical protein n=1 Tax=Wolbachia endosymbiont of Madathamugadia hiepei TaxID=1241303 RepID=UPI00158CB6B7|nr:hypothetical protein [Wolbachia endosymbiont of Madathamugadia hiepei]NUX01344.1 hypothetical protein [Wolbachia endosymbiont of Madathamugadia hiepei]